MSGQEIIALPVMGYLFHAERVFRVNDRMRLLPTPKNFVTEWSRFICKYNGEFEAVVLPKLRVDNDAVRGDGEDAGCLVMRMQSVRRDQNNNHIIFAVQQRDHRMFFGINVKDFYAKLNMVQRRCRQWAMRRRVPMLSIFIIEMNHRLHVLPHDIVEVIRDMCMYSGIGEGGGWSASSSSCCSEHLKRKDPIQVIETNMRKKGLRVHSVNFHFPL